MSVLRGLFTAASKPVSVGELVLYCGDPLAFVGITHTDADGRFELPGFDGPGLLIGRSLAGHLGVGARALEGPEHFVTLEVPGPWQQLTFEVRVRDGEHPAGLEAFLDPEGERGPLTQMGEGETRDHFAVIPLEQAITTVMMPRGVWRLGARSSADLGEPGVRRYVAQHGTVEGHELPGDEASGFELSIVIITTLVFHMRELGHDEA